ncbi:AraC family transcriptional regulator [Pseudomonas fluorescens]|jgi:AraC family transcriptional regulator|uniref:AraC family transcriptional regulator n=1 Tax=Pseudomonas fluorescens TaxID=294 RepID=UPI0005FBEAFD|nr:AraC family transcriptional regulator [Pseudomonas fluorescens]KJZ39623.1 AraC family transcriptional regulator [Pseudomonas fluorescens]
MNPQLQVHETLGLPMLGGMVCSEMPLYAERYFLHATDRSAPPIDSMVLLTQFGGSRVKEGIGGELRSTSMPRLSILVPARCATHWHYSGSIDFAVFYLPERSDGVFQQLREICAEAQAPLPFSDGLVSAAARQLMDELSLGKGADQGFMARLAMVMLEQVYRALRVDAGRGIYPPHIHLARLHAVLVFIREHLGQDLSISTLAGQAGVSPAHFRRLFQRAMGMPPHRYVMNVRLEHARDLLMQTDLPILHVALECGFSSQSHLTAAFKVAHASTPAEYRALNGR